MTLSVIAVDSPQSRVAGRSRMGAECGPTRPWGVSRSGGEGQGALAQSRPINCDGVVSAPRT